MEPTCLNIIFIRVCVCNTCGFHKIFIKTFCTNIQDNSELNQQRKNKIVSEIS